MRCVAIVGPGEEATETDTRLASDIAATLVTELDVYIVTGGLGGVMAAAAQGAERAGGTAIGVVPGRDHRHASPEHSLIIASGMGEARNAIIVNSASVVVAVGTSWGTLSEIALARRAGKLVVQINGSASGETGLVALSSTDQASHADTVKLVCDNVRLGLEPAHQH